MLDRDSEELETLRRGMRREREAWDRLIAARRDADRKTAGDAEMWKRKVVLALSEYYEAVMAYPDIDASRPKLVNR